MSRFACKPVSLGGRTSPQIQLHLNPMVALVVVFIGYLDDLKVPTDRVRSVPCEECLDGRNRDE